MDNYTGKRLDARYEIQEVIGVGGMAVVYKAYDSIDDRIVAVKILKEEFLANEEFRRRFKNESKAIAVLSHPNIVKVYNVSYGDRLQYIVMEYVEGITLKEYIEQQGKLGIKETVHFTMQILRALQHAHDKGIVHRDIKPQNIMLLSNGNIKVTDFGIARFSYSDTKTMTDSAIGSVHYISPEQARGDATDARADIYSVGVVLYEMLTGQLPFQSDNSVSVALMQLQNDPKLPRELNGSIPVGLEQIVMHAMQKNSKNRYQSAAEMLLDIEEFKRNPNIRFQRDYFVDNDPTKYVPTRKPVAAPPVVTPPVKKPVKPDFTDEYEDSYVDTEEKPKGKGGLIAIGVSIAAAVLAVFVFAFLFFFTDVFKGDTLVVPQFIGKNYEEEILNNPDYSEFDIKINEIANSAYENGDVFFQQPGSGQKISKDNNSITLSVASNAKKIVVPDVLGMGHELAQKTLSSKGFNNVKLMPMLSTENFGDVIKIEPEVGEEADSDTIVIVYFASDEDFIEVPNVVGMNFNLEMAELMIKSVQLTVDPEIVEEDSNEPAGIVIAQSPEAGEKVVPGTKVKLTVSNGIPESRMANLEVTLPASGSTRGSFEVFVNSESKLSRTLLMDGSNYPFEVEGSGEAASVKVFIDNREYYSCTVDFTQDPPIVLNGSYGSSGSSRRAIPNVVGMTMEAALAQLESTGFKNYRIQQQAVYNDSENGRVLSQTPSATSSTIIGITQTYSLDTVVTIVVGQKEGI